MQLAWRWFTGLGFDQESRVRFKMCRKWSGCPLPATRPRHLHDNGLVLAYRVRPGRGTSMAGGRQKGTTALARVGRGTRRVDSGPSGRTYQQTHSVKLLSPIDDKVIE